MLYLRAAIRKEPFLVLDDLFPYLLGSFDYYQLAAGYHGDNGIGRLLHGLNQIAVDVESLLIQAT
ncbi:hypothetical protein SDC9_187269 [bioreactor metagenome]|uniref:Uncharacterized protein n=1 Tax=bioreactor metagenome TaxID=1076179 RepID=A0A645HLS9_9ZZZZ